MATIEIAVILAVLIPKISAVVSFNYTISRKL